MRFSLLSGSVLLAAASLFAVPDARFGLVGTGGKAFAEKFGLTWYALEGNQPEFSSANAAYDPTGGRRVLRKVAKLNVRTDGLGQTNAQFETALGDFANALAVWHSFRSGPKPTFTWYVPSPAQLAAAESLKIIETLQREAIAYQIPSWSAWEIGNEPNLFPALLPEDYAALYKRYYTFIKRENPGAILTLGPVFVRELAMDLIPRTREIIGQKLAERGLGQPGQPLFDSVHQDVWAAYSSRTLNLGTVDYLARVLAALDTSVHPDVISLHVYPFEDRLPALSAAQTDHILDSLADSLFARFNARTPGTKIWITEFGNVNATLTAEQAAAQASALIDVFQGNTIFQRWFYYKATGFDTQLLGIPGLPLPLTRLAQDSAFDPPDGNFECARLNAIGRMYYLRSNGAECTDVVGLAAPRVAEGFAARISMPATRGAAVEIRSPGGAHVTVRLMDAAGRVQASLRARTGAGWNTVSLGATLQQLPAGLYHVEVSAPGFRTVLRLSWMRP